MQKSQKPQEIADYDAVVKKKKDDSLNIGKKNRQELLYPTSSLFLTKACNENK